MAKGSAKKTKDSRGDVRPTAWASPVPGTPYSAVPDPESGLDQQLIDSLHRVEHTLSEFAPYGAPAAPCVGCGKSSPLNATYAPSEAESRIRVLEENNKTLVSELLTSKDRITELKGQVDQTNQSISDISKEKKESSQEVTQLRLRLERAMATNETLTAECKAVQERLLATPNDFEQRLRAAKEDAEKESEARRELQQELMAAVARANAAETKIRILESELQSLSVQHESLLSEHKITTDELKAAKRSTSSVPSSTGNDSTPSRSNRSETRSTRSHADEYKKSNDSLRSEMEALRRQLSHMRPAADVINAEKRLEDVHRELGDLRQRYSSLKAENDRVHEDSVRTMSQAQRMYEGEIAESKVLNQKMTTQLEESKRSEESARRDAENAHRLLEEARSSLASLTKERNDLTRQVSNIQADLSVSGEIAGEILAKKLRGRVLNVSKDLSRLSESNSYVKSQVLELQHAFADSLVHIGNHLGVIACSANNKAAEVKLVQDKLDRVQNDYEVARRGVMDIEAKNERLVEENSIFKTKLVNIQHHLEIAESKNEILMKRAREHEDCDRIQTNLRGDVSTLEKKLADEREELAKVTSRLDEVCQEHSGTESLVRDGREQVGRLQAQLTAAQDEVKDLNATVRARNEHITALDNEISSLKEKHLREIMNMRDTYLHDTQAAEAPVNTSQPSTMSRLSQRDNTLSSDRECKKLKRRIEGLVDDLEHERSAKDKLSAEVHKFEEEMVTQMVQMQTLTTENATLLQTVSNLRTQLDYNQDNSNMKSESIAAENRSLSTEIRALKARLDEAENELHNTVRSSQDRIDKMVEVDKNLRDELQEVKNARDQSIEKLKGVMAEVSSGRERMEQLIGFCPESSPSPVAAVGTLIKGALDEFSKLADQAQTMDALWSNKSAEYEKSIQMLKQKLHNTEQEVTAQSDGRRSSVQALQDTQIQYDSLEHSYAEMRDHLQSMEERCIELTEENENLLKRANSGQVDLQKKIEEVARRNSELELELVGAQGMTSELEDERRQSVASKNRIAELENDLAEIEDQKTAAEQRASRLEDEVSKMGDALRVLQGEGRSELARLDAMNKDLAAKLQETSQRALNAETFSIELQRKLVEDVSNLQSANKDLEDQLVEAQKAYRQVETEKNNLTVDVERTRGAVKERETELSKVLTTLKGMEEELGTTKDTYTKEKDDIVAAMAKERENYSKLIADSYNHLVQFKDAYVQLEQRYGEATARLTSTGHEVAKLEESNVKLERLLKEEREINSGLQKAMSDWQEKMSSLQQLISEQERKTSETQREYAALQQRHQEEILEEQANFGKELKELSEKHKAELDVIMNKVTEVESEGISYRKKMISTEEELSSWKEKCSHLEQEVELSATRQSAAEDQCVKLNKECAEHQVKLNEFEERYSQAEDMITKSQSELAACKAAMLDLENNLDQARKENQTAHSDYEVAATRLVHERERTQAELDVVYKSLFRAKSRCSVIGALAHLRTAVLCSQLNEQRAQAEEIGSGSRKTVRHLTNQKVIAEKMTGHHKWRLAVSLEKIASLKASVHETKEEMNLVRVKLLNSCLIQGDGMRRRSRLRHAVDKWSRLLLTRDYDRMEELLHNRIGNARKRATAVIFSKGDRLLLSKYMSRWHGWSARMRWTELEKTQHSLANLRYSLKNLHTSRFHPPEDDHRSVTMSPGSRKGSPRRRTVPVEPEVSCLERDIDSSLSELRNISLNLRVTEGKLSEVEESSLKEISAMEKRVSEEKLESEDAHKEEMKQLEKKLEGALKDAVNVKEELERQLANEMSRLEKEKDHILTDLNGKIDDQRLEFDRSLGEMKRSLDQTILELESSRLESEHLSERNRELMNVVEELNTEVAREVVNKDLLREESEKILQENAEVLEASYSRSLRSFLKDTRKHKRHDASTGGANRSSASIPPPVAEYTLHSPYVSTTSGPRPAVDFSPESLREKLALQRVEAQRALREAHGIHRNASNLVAGPTQTNRWLSPFAFKRMEPPASRGSTRSEMMQEGAHRPSSAPPGESPVVRTAAQRLVGGATVPQVLDGRTSAPVGGPDQGSDLKETFKHQHAMVGEIRDLAREQEYQMRQSMNMIPATFAARVDSETDSDAPDLGKTHQVSTMRRRTSRDRAARNAHREKLERLRSVTPRDDTK